jgi:hypothetical protein
MLHVLNLSRQHLGLIKMFGCWLTKKWCYKKGFSVVRKFSYKNNIDSSKHMQGVQNY